MNSYFNPIVLLTCLTLLGTNLTGMAQENVRKKQQRPEQVDLQVAKQKVAGMRKKAAQLKEMGRMEEYEALDREAKQLYAKIMERSGKAQNGRDRNVDERRQVLRGRMIDVEHRIEQLRDEGRHDEAEKLEGRAREMVASMRGEGEHIVERLVIRERRDGERDEERLERREREIRRERGPEGHPERREISPEDHVRIAIENLHAAGWHEVAERVEEEFHHRMEEQHAREQGHDGPELLHMMEAFEHRFEEVAHRFEDAERRFEEAHRQFEHLERAIGEAHERIERIERHLHEREEHRD